jgi:hypothetical protein
MNWATLAISVLVLIGCAATAVNSGAERVRLTNAEPGRDCKLLGDATGNQGNEFIGPFISNANLETGARNDIKNKAAEMGGNVVYVLTQRAGQSGITPGRQTNVTLSGHVYRCPE